ncbi:Diphthamide biosynthesis protein 4 [Rhodotorula kratochvilovae]
MHEEEGEPARGGEARAALHPAAKLDAHAAAGALQHPLARVDLYARLGLPRSASQVDIRQAYRALILQHHPDRASRASVQEPVAGTSAPLGVSAEELNEAYEVLSDEARRRSYDAARAAQLATTRGAANAFAVSLSLDLFEPHYLPPGPSDAHDHVEDGEEDDPAYYTHPCRCSSQFKVTREQLEEGVEVITCEGCSERCRVEYEVIEE